MAEAAVDTTKPTPKPDASASIADRVMAKLDSIAAQNDSLATRMDAIEAKQSKADASTVTVKSDASKDDCGPDGKKRGDEWPDKDKDKDDSAKSKKAKADEDEDEDKDKKKEDSKSKRADRDKDENTTVENVTKGDDAKSKRADWDDEDKDKKEDSAKPKKAKADEGKGEDEQEREIAKGDARADEVSMLKARLARLEKRDDMSEDDRASYAAAQSRADEVMALFGKQAKRWNLGESVADYRRRLVTELRKHSPMWADTKMSELPDSAFNNIEKQIYADAAVAAQQPTDLAEGELRPVVKIDRDTGMRSIHFYGESFIKSLGRPARQVAGFRQRNAAN